MPDTFYEFPRKLNFISSEFTIQKIKLSVHKWVKISAYPNDNSNVKTLQVDSSSGEGTLEKNGYFTAGEAGLYNANCS